MNLLRVEFGLVKPDLDGLSEGGFFEGGFSG